MWNERPIPDQSLSAVDLLARWPADTRALLLHSGRPHKQWSRRSIMAAPAFTLRSMMNPDGGIENQWIQDSDHPFVLPTLSGQVFSDMRSALRWQHELNPHSPAADGVWIGHFSYEFGRHVQRFKARTQYNPWPLLELSYCPGYFERDEMTGRWRIVGDDSWLPQIDASTPLAVEGEMIHMDGEWRSNIERCDYEAKVHRAIEYIAAGDVFQVNLSRKLENHAAGKYPSGHRQTFAQLSASSPAWYGGYLEQASPSMDEARRSLASVSPELFLQVDAQGNVMTRPIKGTRPADVDVSELLNSAKDIAELTMIVDLIRNDLGRVCDYGSVRVLDPRSIESHPTVHHGVAAIVGRLHPEKDIVDLLRATMPGGSITGAPKIRAMQIIDELEPHIRGPYCGAMGMIGRDELCFNIAIRTAMIEQCSDNGMHIQWHAGGGIVADSDPAAEFEETSAKAAAVVKALPAARPNHAVSSY